MPWNRTTRKDYRRNARRYESDVTDQEWAIIEPMLPKQGPTGRPRKTDLREVFNAIQYVLATGCQWRALPRDFPPYSTVINYFYRWQASGVFDRMMDALRDLARAEELSRQRRLSTLRASRRRRAVGHAAMMAARRLWAASAILSLMSKALRSWLRSTRRRCKTETVRRP